MTPLYIAATLNLTSITLTLIEAGAGVSKSDEITALHMAVWNRNVDVVRALLSAGADVNAMSNPGHGCFTPLLIALQTRRIDTTRNCESERRIIVKELVEKGCDVNLSSRNKPCPLGMCAHMGDTEMMRLLLDAGANVGDVNSSSGRTPVMDVIDSSNVDCLQLLVERGANLYSSCKFGPWKINETLLDHAAAKHNFPFVELMLDAGCKMSKNVMSSVVKGCEKFLSETEVKDLKLTGMTVSSDNDSFFKISKAYDEKRVALKNIVKMMGNVVSLKQTCRSFLRRECHIFLPKDVDLLPMPSLLKNYILCKRK